MDFAKIDLRKVRWAELLRGAREGHARGLARELRKSDDNVPVDVRAWLADVIEHREPLPANRGRLDATERNSLRSDFFGLRVYLDLAEKRAVPFLASRYKLGVTQVRAIITPEDRQRVKQVRQRVRDSSGKPLATGTKR